MGGQLTRSALYDSLGAPFPSASHRCPHRAKPRLPAPCGPAGAALPLGPLLFHPRAKGCQIAMDPAQKSVKRQGSFCNAITFSQRPVALYEQVRLKITKKQSCWSGALRLGFTCTDPGSISPRSLPKYACPDLVAQSGFWAKALPEEFAGEGNVVSFWVDKKGRVFYRVNASSPMLFFSGVRTAEPLWALIDVYGLTRGVQLLDSEPGPADALRPRSSSLRSRLSVSLCDLNLPEEGGGASRRQAPHLAPSACPIPQNCLNSQRCSLLPPALDSELHFHQLRGAHIAALDPQTVARSEQAREERTLVFTHRPLRRGETVYVKVSKSSPAGFGSLSYGVTSCDPAALRPGDLPTAPEALVDRKEFWAVCRVPTPLQTADILGVLVDPEGQLILSHNGSGVGTQVCVDHSRPLWMFFGLHGAVTQLRILGSTQGRDPGASSGPASPSSSPRTPCALGGGGGGGSDPVLNGGLCSAAGTTPRSPGSSECSICYENAVDTVIYACGHMCLCSSCGLKLKKTPSACCPICRRHIKDIIKTYRST